MSKQNTMKSNKTAQEAFKLTEQQLKEEQAKLIEQRENDCLKAVNEALIKFNCSLTTDIQVLLNNQSLKIVIKSN
jgi:hypothetical protein